MDNALRYVWGQYRAWAATSRRLKAQIARWGVIVLGLTVSGTALGTLGTSLVPDAAGGNTVLPWVAAAALGLATYFATQLLDASSRSATIRARAVAEAIKSECYKYVTKTPPYEGHSAPEVLAVTAEELQRTASGILLRPIDEAERTRHLPSAPWTIADYVAGRVRDQIERFYHPAIRRHRRAVQRARVLALMLGAAAVILSAAGGGSSQWMPALLGTVTTAAAAIGAWFQSGNHLQNALNYQAAVAKLEFLLVRHQRTADLPALVSEAEAIFQAEHGAWLAQWQPDGPREAPAPAGGSSALSGTQA